MLLDFASTLNQHNKKAPLRMRLISVFDVFTSAISLKWIPRTSCSRYLQCSSWTMSEFLPKLIIAHFRLLLITTSGQFLVQVVAIFHLKIVTS